MFHSDGSIHHICSIWNWHWVDSIWLLPVHLLPIDRKSQSHLTNKAVPVVYTLWRSTFNLHEFVFVNFVHSFGTLNSYFSKRWTSLFLNEIHFYSIIWRRFLLFYSYAFFFSFTLTLCYSHYSFIALHTYMEMSIEIFDVWLAIMIEINYEMPMLISGWTTSSF